MSFGRLRQRILLICVQRVRHDYFSLFNQSYHCFRAWSLQLLSSLLKLPNRELEHATFLNHGRQPEVRLFFHWTSLHTATFILLSIFSLVEAISVKIWERPLSWHAKCSLPVSRPWLANVVWLSSLLSLVALSKTCIYNDSCCVSREPMAGCLSVNRWTNPTVT